MTEIPAFNQIDGEFEVHRGFERIAGKLAVTLRGMRVAGTEAELASAFREARIEAEKGTADIWELKQVRGGLVDIEFLTQFLQIASAHEHKVVLQRNTAAAAALDDHAAEDIAQEAFLAAVRNLDHFDRSRSFGPWLHRIVVNRAMAERDASLAARMRAMFDDLRLVYVGLSAAVAATICLISMAGMMRVATEHRPDSLAAILNLMAGPFECEKTSSIPDALASTANYLSQSGWKSNERWGEEVRLPADFPYETADPEIRMPVSDWTAKGVRRLNGEPLAESSESAAIFLPAGVRGPAFLVYANFYAILKYNFATSYALAVSVLSDRLKGQSGIAGSWPRDDEMLSVSQRVTLQEGLTTLGYDTGGADGVLGRRTRAAIREFQKARGLPDLEVRKEAEVSIAALHPLLVRDARQAAIDGNIDLAWELADAALAARPDDVGMTQLRQELLRRHKVCPRGKLQRIRTIIRKMSRTRSRPRLTHGDLRLKNVLVDDDGKIKAILDWEKATSNLSPQWELSVALHDLSIDGMNHFLEGYGLSSRKYLAIADDIKDVYGEAKSMGFDTKILRKVISIRKQDADERMEQEAILDTYLQALGMIPAAEDAARAD